MLRIVAVEVTATLEYPLILEPQRTVRVRLHDVETEVDQVAVVGGVTLDRADTVGVVAGRARRLRAHHAPLVREAPGIAQQNITIISLLTQPILI